MSVLHTFLLLLVAHALCDYSLQGDFMARAKNANAPVAGVPWQQAMAAHCLIHAGAVALVTGSVWLGMVEFSVHWITDRAKCDNLISYNGDQAIHVAFKLVWAVLA